MTGSWEDPWPGEDRLPWYDQLPGFNRELYYDRQGRPLDDMYAWGRLHQDLEYKRVAADQVGRFWVSTVWLGLDHRLGPGPPLIFETMVFADTSRSTPLGDDEYMRRYATEEEARRGHAQVVGMLGHHRGPRG